MCPSISGFSLRQRRWQTRQICIDNSTRSIEMRRYPDGWQHIASSEFWYLFQFCFLHWMDLRFWCQTVIYHCRISTLNEHQIYHNERLSMRNHRGNCNRFKMQPTICKKQFITLMTLTPPITLSMYSDKRIEKRTKPQLFQIYQLKEITYDVCVCCSNWFIFRFITRSSDEVLHIISNILEALQRARTSLVIPKKKPIDELMKSRNMVSLIVNFIEMTNLIQENMKILTIFYFHFVLFSFLGHSRNPWYPIYQTI